MHFFLEQGKHWKLNRAEPHLGILNADLAKWIRQHVSSYSFDPNVGYDRKGVPRLEIIIPIPEQAMLFKLTWQ